MKVTVEADDNEVDVYIERDRSGVWNREKALVVDAKERKEYNIAKGQRIVVSTRGDEQRVVYDREQMTARRVSSSIADRMDEDSTLLYSEAQLRDQEERDKRLDAARRESAAAGRGDKPTVEVPGETIPPRDKGPSESRSTATQSAGARQTTSTQVGPEGGTQRSAQPTAPPSRK